MVCEVKPAQCTLVPDPPDALTSSDGWDCKTHMSFLKEVTGRLRESGVRSSIFLNPEPEMVPYAVDCGTDRIELYTEMYASSYGTDKQEEVFSWYQNTAEIAVKSGLGLNAGHDLNQENLGFFDKNIAGLQEVSIGHALVVEMIYQGMDTTVANYQKILRGE